MMVAFLSLLLVCLEGMTPLSYFVVFAPLWASDSITLATGAHEIWRVARTRPDRSARPRGTALPRTFRASTSFAPARSYLRFFARGGAAGASQRFAPRPTRRDDAGPTRDVTPQASRR